MKYVGNAEPHYGLRKLSIGVASVLLGMTVTGIVGHADAEAPVNNSKNVSVDESVSDSNLNGSNQVILRSKQTGGDNISAVNSEGDNGNVESDSQQASVSTLNASNVSNILQAVSQSLVGTQSTFPNNSINSAVSNVNIKYSAPDEKVMHIPAQPWSIDTVGSFNLDLSKVQLNHSVVLGHWQQSSDTGSVMSFNALSGNQPVFYKSQNIGYLSFQYADLDKASTDNFLFTLTSVPVVSGIININFSAPGWFVLNANTAKNFRGVQKSNNVFSFVNNEGKTTSSLHLNIQHAQFSRFDQEDLNWVKHRMAGDAAVHGMLTNTTGNGRSNVVLISTWPGLNIDEVAETLHGDNISKPLHLDVSNYEFGVHVYAANGETILNGMPSRSVSAAVYGHTADSYMVDSQDRYVDAVSGTPVFMNSNSILQTVVFADDMSLQQMKKNADLSKNIIGISHQSDGSLLYFVNLTPDFFTSDVSDTDALNIANQTAVVNADIDPNKAAQNSVDVMKRIFHNRMRSLYIWQSIALSDPTLATKINVDSIDVNSGNVIAFTTSNFIPNSYSVKGQSTVKLHFVNSDSGTELSRVQSFTDWPNQGKHAQLSIPKITGYHLETNAPQSVLTKFGLKGTALTTNSAVDYPAEDTISDYYFVMAPNDETATVNIVDADEGNKVLSTGTITGKFGQVVSLSSNLQSNLDTLMATGHYVESANDLDGEVTYGDGVSKVYTIRLKHKLDSVQRHYRVIEDLPDGRQKVILDVNATLYKDSDVDYYGERGAYVNGDGTKTLLKSNNVSISTGYVVPGDPSGDNLQSMLIDNVPGYSWSFVDQTYGFDHGVQARLNTTSQLALLDIFNGTTGLAYNDFKRGAAAIDPLASRDFHIKYLKNQYPVVVSYYDQSGHQISTLTKSYDYLTQLDLTANTPANYVLLTGQNTKLTVGYDHNEIDLLVVPKITQRQEQKIIRRIIEITDPQGLEHDIEQDVVFVRNVYHDNAANSDTESSWRVLGRDHFVAYIPAVVDGYTAQSASDQVALPTDQDQIIKLSYTPLTTLSEPKYIDAKGIGCNELPADYEVVNGQNGENGSMLIIKKPAPVVTNKVEYVTRTITIEMPNGHKRTITQKARKGSKFIRAHLPKLRGYQVQIDGNVNFVDANGNRTATVKFVKI